MHRQFSKLFLPLFLVALFSLAVAARADTVVITGGSATQQTPTYHTYDITGQGFRASGWGYMGRYPCEPCAQTSVLNLNEYWSGEDMLKNGPATFNGTDYQQLYYTGNMTFTTDLFSIPTDSPTGYFTVSVPFTLSGHLYAYSLNPFVGSAGPAVFSVDVSGEGMVVMELFGIDTSSGRLYSSHSLTFNFQSTTPTPEPATLFLLGTGLAGLATKGYRRYKKMGQS